MTPAVVVGMLMLLLGLQPVTTDLYLPALPMLRHEFDSGVGPAQFTLSAMMLSFGIGQLICGPLADRHGRRPVLLGGMALYATAAVFSALAQSMPALIGWRAVQGLGLASAVTCGRSIVRDLFEPHQGAAVMSRALGGLGALAMVSPLVGAALAQWAGWRAVLLAPALFAALTLVFLARRYDETVPRRNRDATRLGPMLGNWSAVLRHPTFRAWAALMSCTYGGMFVLLASSSFVFIEVLGSSRVAYGLIMTSCSGAYVAGTLLCTRLLRRHGLRWAVRLGGLFSLAGGLAMAGLSLTASHSVWAIVLPQWIYALGHGIHQPCSQAGAVGPFPQMAGTAAALSGFLLTLTALVISGVLSRAMNGTVYPLTLGIGAMSVVVATIAWTLVQRDGDPTPARA